MLYVIIGASLSGKTSARKYITGQWGISGIDSDTLRTMTNDLRPDLIVGHQVPVMTNYQNMRQTINSFVHARSFFNEDYVLEGDSINIEDVARHVHDGNAKVVIVAYPDSVADERIRHLNIDDPYHWSHRIDLDTFTQKMNEFIRFGSFLRDEAARFDLDFIDISDNPPIEDVIRRIADSFSLR